MFVVEKIDESNKQQVIDVLRSDVIRHVLAYYDIQHDPEHTAMYAAFENGRLRGYLLIYTALEFPSVVLECESGIAKKLIEYMPESSFIIHIPWNLLPIKKGRFPDAKHYVENWMLVKSGGASFFESELVRRLCSEDDALGLFRLLSSPKDRTTRTVQKHIELIAKQPIFGVFVEGELVSYAGSFIQLPQVWMIGGFTRVEIIEVRVMQRWLRRR